MLKKGEALLKAANNQWAANDSRVLLSFALNRDKTFLLSHYDYQLTADEKANFEKLIELRAKGMPLQYITGQQEFMSLKFLVNSHVLIPRQETEILVETIVEYAEKLGKSSNISILEIGTGSGCIAVSLAFYIKNCFVTAVDISEEALQTAKSNAVLNGVDKKINFILSDLFENVGNNKFDIIVSNPPYIRKEELAQLDIEVREYEPITALDGGMDGLDFYRAIVEEAPAYLKDKGLLAFEIGYNQAKDVACLMENYFSDIKIIKDLDKNDRVVIGGMDLERI